MLIKGGNMAVLPDPQIAYMDALEDSFSNELDKLEDTDEILYWSERWSSVDKDALTFGPDYLDEAWGPDIEEGIEVMNHAMSKDMQDRIKHKEQILQEMSQS
jgi:hypothetical protein